MVLRGEIKNAETLGRMLQQWRLLRGLSQQWKVKKVKLFTL